LEATVVRRLLLYKVLTPIREGKRTQKWKKGDGDELQIGRICRKKGPYRVLRGGEKT